MSAYSFWYERIVGGDEDGETMRVDDFSSQPGAQSHRCGSLFVYGRQLVYGEWIWTPVADMTLR